MELESSHLEIQNHLQSIDSKQCLITTYKKDHFMNFNFALLLTEQCVLGN